MGLPSDSDLGVIAELTQEQCASARLVIARHAFGAEDESILLAMLDLKPTVAQAVPTSECRSCRRTITRQGSSGSVRRGAGELCVACYSRRIRAEKAGLVVVVVQSDIDTPLGMLAAGTEIKGRKVSAGWRLHLPRSRRVITTEANSVRLADSEATQ